MRRHVELISTTIGQRCVNQRHATVSGSFQLNPESQSAFAVHVNASAANSTLSRYGATLAGRHCGADTARNWQRATSFAALMEIVRALSPGDDAHPASRRRRHAETSAPMRRRPGRALQLAPATSCRLDMTGYH